MDTKKFVEQTQISKFGQLALNALDVDPMDANENVGRMLQGIGFAILELVVAVDNAAQQ